MALSRAGLENEVLFSNYINFYCVCFCMCVGMPPHSLEVKVQLAWVSCSVFMRDLNTKLRFLELTAIFYLLPSHLSIPKILTFYSGTNLPSRVAKSWKSTSFNTHGRSFVLLLSHDMLLSLRVCSVTVPPVWWPVVWSKEPRLLDKLSTGSCLASLALPTSSDQFLIWTNSFFSDRVLELVDREKRR